MAERRVRSNSADRDAISAESSSPAKTPRNGRKQPARCNNICNQRIGIRCLIHLFCYVAIFLVEYTIYDLRYKHLYLIFDATQLSNQGAGNIMKGLYAVHTLGPEFGRTVCVIYPDFERFFAPQQNAKQCQTAMEHLERYKKANKPIERLTLLDYESIDECNVKDALSSFARLVIVTGNTYPRWPHRTETTTPPLAFHDLYSPKVDMSWTPNQYSPRNKNRSTPIQAVVHLRSPDNESFDARDGLDETSLQSMESLVQESSVVLVSNNVDHYQRFAAIWSHPPWTSIAHSANHIVWGTAETTKRTTVQDEAQHLWMDWYTMVSSVANHNATVYHTRSAFSESAVLWSGGGSHKSFTFVTTGGQLRLQPDDDVLSVGNELPLSQRTNLDHCGVYEERVRETRAVFEGLRFAGEHR